MIYRANPPGGMRIVPLDSLTAIYHRASGQTHVVTEPVPEILVVLGSGAQDVEGFLEALCLTDDAGTRALLTERLDELVATGLVART